MAHKLVIIEDDAFIQKAYSVSLEKAGFDVEVEGDGELAIAAIKKHKPRLILLDIILPGKNGFEILKDIRAEKSFDNIPVMIVSNLEQQGDVSKGFKLGAIDYVLKATTPIHELVKKVDVILN